MGQIAEGLGLDTATAWIFAGIAACLVGGTVLRGIPRWRRADARAVARWRSLMSWWALFVLIAGAVIVGRRAVAVVLVATAGLALRESLALGRRLGAAPAKVAAVLVALSGPGFALGVAWLPAPAAHPDARLGWLVLLLVLTELDDMAQAWWGRALGSHRLAPRVSPNKTWEGLVGGVATTVAAASVLAPLITDYGGAAPPAGSDRASAWVWAPLVGLVVSAAGTAGDLCVSALKRRAGTKDSGDMLPGQGGVLDRIDSLSLSAPAYLATTWLLWLRT